MLPVTAAALAPGRTSAAAKRPAAHPHARRRDPADTCQQLLAPAGTCSIAGVQHCLSSEYRQASQDQRQSETPRQMHSAGGYVFLPADRKEACQDSVAVVQDCQGSWTVIC